MMKCSSTRVADYDLDAELDAEEDSFGDRLEQEVRCARA